MQSTRRTEGDIVSLNVRHSAARLDPVINDNRPCELDGFRVPAVCGPAIWQGFTRDKADRCRRCSWAARLHNPRSEDWKRVVALALTVCAVTPVVVLLKVEAFMFEEGGRWKRAIARALTVCAVTPVLRPLVTDACVPTTRAVVWS